MTLSKYSKVCVTPKMNVSVAQIQNHLMELKNLKDQFNTLSLQSNDKLFKIMDIVKSYQTRMEPLNKDMEQLQVQQKNIEACQLKLSRVQSYRSTGREVESIIQQGPGTPLDPYLKAMERIQDALSYFRQNNPDDVEHSRLSSLYSVGLHNLDKEFDSLLKQTFRPVQVETLFKIVDKRVSSSDTGQGVNIAELEELENVPIEMLNNLRFLAKWMNQNQSFSFGITPQPGTNFRGCLARYRDFRREHLRQTLFRLREFLRRIDAQGSSTSASSRGSTLSVTRTRPKRLPGFVWDVNTVRQLNEHETNDLDSEHYATAIAAFAKLIQNERVHLDRLQMTSSPNETLQVLDAILKAGFNEISVEGTTFTRLMQRAQGRAEFYMILSILLVLKKFSVIGEELNLALQNLDQMQVDCNQLVMKLLQQTKQTLETYVEFLRQVPERSNAVSAMVPADGTIHELTTNALFYLENLVEYTDIIAVALSIGDVSHHNPTNTIAYLCNSVRNRAVLEPRTGSFMYQALLALLANLDRKSESYTDDILRLIFQMNNVQYMLRTINKTDIHRLILSNDPEGIAKIGSVLNDRKSLYSRSCARILAIPGVNLIGRLSASNRAMDPKERSAVKSMWQDFNTGFSALLKQHASASVPDRDLRASLERQLIGDLVPNYKVFWERSMSMSFTTHRDKYMKMSVEQFENYLKNLFRS